MPDALFKACVDDEEHVGNRHRRLRDVCREDHLRDFNGFKGEGLGLRCTKYAALVTSWGEEWAGGSVRASLTFVIHTPHQLQSRSRNHTVGFDKRSSVCCVDQCLPSLVTRVHQIRHVCRMLPRHLLKANSTKQQSAHLAVPRKRRLQCTLLVLRRHQRVQHQNLQRHPPVLPRAEVWGLEFGVKG